VKGAPSLSVAQPTATTLHWHAHPVASISLSPDGRFMFSGGDEGVLVVWQLATGIKNFVPRLGEAITFVSSSTVEARLAVTTADNSVRIINTASLKTDWEMKALYIPVIFDTKRAKSAKREKSSSKSSTQVATQSDPYYQCSIQVEGRSGCIACNGYPGQLQIFDLATQTFRTVHEIMQYSRVSKKEAYSQMRVPSTTHYHFLDTPLGSLMVTLDVRRGEDSEAEGSLKFWKWNAQGSRYQLSAQVDRPHGSSRVTSVVFAPSSTQTLQRLQQPQGIAPSSSSSSFTCSCATAAVDGGIKIWVGQSHPSKASDRSGSAGSATDMHWTCSFSFKHRGYLAGAMSFSFDGSLLAVAHENVVTLWDPTQVLLRKSIVGSSRNSIIFSAFVEPRASAVMGGGAGEAMLILGTDSSLSVYDLMSMQLMWSVEENFSCFAVASDESAAIRCEGDNTIDKKKSLAWIAASINKKVVIDLSTGKTSKKETQNEIVLYSCYSSKPLSIQKLGSKATSMTFWSNQRDLTSSLSSGLVLLTEQGEIMTVGATEALKQYFSDRSSTVSNAAHAKVFGQKLPSLPFSALVHRYSNETDGVNDIDILQRLSASTLQQGSVTAEGSKGWLEGMFDSKSSSIPPLSAIYGKQYQKPEPFFCFFFFFFF
jgi:WD40 repeat protein